MLESYFQIDIPLCQALTLPGLQLQRQAEASPVRRRRLLGRGGQGKEPKQEKYRYRHGGSLKKGQSPGASALHLKMPSGEAASRGLGRQGQWAMGACSALESLRRRVALTGSTGDQFAGQVVLSADVGQPSVAAFEEVGQLLVVQTQQ